MTGAQARRGDDLAPHERCTWVKSNNKQCRSPRATDGVDTFCVFHHDFVAERTRIWRASAQQEDVSLEDHLKMELRISYTMVKVAEMQMLDMGLSADAFHHESLETEDKASPSEQNTYVSTKRATVMGAHPLIVTFLREREQHVSVIKTCISAGLVARQVAAVERTVDSMMSLAVTLTEALGHDPGEADVREVLLRCIRAQATELEKDVPKSLTA